MTEPYYQDDFATIYHGDCREVLAWLVADVLITDPPYGIDYRGAEGGASRPGHPRVAKGELSSRPIAGDEDLISRDRALELWGDRPALVFGSWKKPRPASTRMVLTWEKGPHAGMGDLSLPWRPNTEEVYVIGSGFVPGARRSSVLRFNAPSNIHPRLHPTAKPVDLMCGLVSCTAGLVADPFMGSGSTLRAAKNLGRKCIGVEIEERYCEITAKRLAQEVLDFGGVA